MKIAIIGAGNVGGTLGRRWARNGHTVIFSSRNPQSEEMKRVLAEAGPNASAASVRDAAAQSEVVTLAAPWQAAKSAIQSAGDLSGRILIDTTNPLKKDLSGMEVGGDTSAAEQVAAWAKGAKVVKCFNNVGFNVMADPRFDGKSALMFYCGDDAAAKDVVRKLAGELGFDPCDVGGLEKARIIEPISLLWITLSIELKTREFAFQIIRRG